MGKCIVIIQGHPDTQTRHFGHALALAYAEGAQSGGHEVRFIPVAELDFPMLRTKEDWETGAPPDSILKSQQMIRWADHLLIIYPLWMGFMPAILKAFLEQTFRPGFALSLPQSGAEPSAPRVASKRTMPKRLLTGKSARIVVTMGMPALVYRWYFRAHSLKGLQRNILGFAGIKPVKTSVIGGVEESDADRQKWLAEMREHGLTAD
jgi:putative NADPH-quinone reductase